MLARARQRIALIDASKFGRSATYVVGTVSNVSHVISDPALPARWRQSIENTGVELFLAETRAEP
jgi:DeoR/GlpR family transcriptional regulator of sugar metabolism